MRNSIEKEVAGKVKVSRCKSGGQRTRKRLGFGNLLAAFRQRRFEREAGSDSNISSWREPAAGLREMKRPEFTVTGACATATAPRKK